MPYNEEIIRMVMNRDTFADMMRSDDEKLVIVCQALLVYFWCSIVSLMIFVIMYAAT